MATEAGSVFVRLGGIFDRKGFDEYDRNVVKAQKVKDINARLGAEVVGKDFELYNRKLDEVRAKTKLRDAYKVTLGADYDSRAFNAYYRDLTRASAATKAADRDTNLLTRSFKALAGSASGAGGAMGGGGGLGSIVPGLSGGFVALVGSVSLLLPALLAVAGAATALAGSLAAAAAGAAAVGVGVAAALGPLAAIAGAVAVRVSAMSEAFKSLGTEQTKGGAQAQAAAEQQRAAAQRVQQAQEGVTKARFLARREVEDLTAAVERSRLAEQDAALALESSQRRASAVRADPRSSGFDIRLADQDVKDARLRAREATTERQRALEDEKRGTDTLRQAQRQLVEARHAATVAAQKEGAAATDAQQKLGKLSDTERRLVVDFKAFVDQLTKIFKPATDAIFGSVDRGLKLITPLVGRYKGQFAGIGQAIADVIDRAGKSLTGPGWTQALDSFVATARKLVKPIGDSVGSVLLIFRNIAVATQPLVIQLARWMRDALGGLADKTEDAGRLRDVIRGLVEHTKSWAKFMGAVGQLFFTIFSGGAKQGQGLIDTLTTILKRWNAFLQTDEGQRKMRAFFRDSIELTKKIAGFLADVVGAFLRVGRFLESHTDLIKLAAKAWVAYKVAAVAAGIAAKGAAVASFFRGGAAGAAGGAAGSALTKGSPLIAGGAGAGAAGLAGLGAGAAATGVGIVALGGYLTLMSQLERKSRQLRDGFQVATSAARKMAEAGDPEGIKRLSDSIDAWGKSTGATREEVSKLKSVLGEFEKAAEVNVGGVGRVLSQAGKHFEDFRKTGSNNLHGLHVATADNMHFIKRTLGTESEAGKKALVGNFKLAEQAIRDAMTDGKVSTRDGLREIRRLMKEELAVYGITGQKATDYLRVKGHGSGNETAAGGHAAGGWIGAPGMVGTDTVPAMLGAGEAVLNRHQQAVIEGMLGHGFLDDLFANVQTPHYLATGGYVQGAVPPRHAAAQALAQDMFGRGFSVTSAYRSDSSTYHGSGDALDFGNSVNDLGRVWSVLFPKRNQFAELFGPAGLYHFGQRFQDQKLQAGHNDHVHVAILRALAGALGGGGGTIKAPGVTGGGALGGVVGGALKNVARGASSRLGQIVGGLGGGHAGGSGAVAKGASTNVVSAFRSAIRSARAMPVERLALWEAGIVESGLKNLSYGDADSLGSLQERVSIYGRAHAMNPLASAMRFLSQAAARRPWRGSAGRLAQAVQGSAFPGRYDAVAGQARQYLARGGRVQRFASGGRPTFTGGSPQQTTSGSGRTSLSDLRGTQKIRVSSYDNLLTGVVDDQRTYGQVERRYNQSGEVFIDPKTGELNQDAIERRAGELGALMHIRERILQRLEQALAIARRVVRTYSTILTRLKRSLKHAKGKDRSGIRADISAYEGERTTWLGNVKEMGFQVEDAKIDIGDLKKEGGELRGIVADPTAADAAAGADPSSSDTAVAGNSPDVDAIIAQFQTAAATAGANLVSANQVIAAFGSSGDIGTGGSNAVSAVRNESQAIGAQFAPAGSLPAAPATVINNYNMPGTPNVLRAIGDAATAGQSLQPAVNSSIERLGI